jgi:hypothetical protein
MNIRKLIEADIHRDGGSYGASFETDDDRIYSIWLQRSRMPDGGGPHHRWLFEYFGRARPSECLPVVTGSDQERALLARLKDFAELVAICPSSDASHDDAIARLRELIHYIEHREPCFPSDLVGRSFAQT